MEYAKGNRKGYGLIEVIIASFLLFMVLVFTAPFIISVYRNSNSGGKLSYSVPVEEIVRENIESLSYDSVSNALNKGNTSCADALKRGVNVIKIQQNGKTVTYGVYYSVKELEPGFRKRVDVTLCWKNRGKIAYREVLIEKTKR